MIFNRERKCNDTSKTMSISCLIQLKTIIFNQESRQSDRVNNFAWDWRLFDVHKYKSIPFLSQPTTRLLGRLHHCRPDTVCLTSSLFTGYTASRWTPIGPYTKIGSRHDSSNVYVHARKVDRRLEENKRRK